MSIPCCMCMLLNLRVQLVYEWNEEHAHFGMKAGILALYLFSLFLTLVQCCTFEFSCSCRRRYKFFLIMCVTLNKFKWRALLKNEEIGFKKCNILVAAKQLTLSCYTCDQFYTWMNWFAAALKPILRFWDGLSHLLSHVHDILNFHVTLYANFLVLILFSITYPFYFEICSTKERLYLCKMTLHIRPWRSF